MAQAVMARGETGQTATPSTARPRTSKYLGTHGQRPLYADNAAFFLAVGAGVRRGVALGPIRSRDVAPTVAATLGLRMEAVEGATLDRALD